MANLLTPELLRRLEQLQLLARRRAKSSAKGERRSRARGQSVEFADYRNTGGLQLPDTIRVVNAGGAGLTIRRAVSRKVNIPIKDSAFSNAGA